jgi:hypothetical protein
MVRLAGETACPTLIFKQLHSLVGQAFSQAFSLPEPFFSNLLKIAKGFALEIPGRGSSLELLRRRYASC